MMTAALILFPLFMAATAFMIPSNRLRPLILPATAIPHFSLIVTLLGDADLSSGTGSLLLLDPAGKTVITVVSLLFSFCSFYAVATSDTDCSVPTVSSCSAWPYFPGIMSLVCLSQHLGLTWVAIEATTLSMAPLIYFNRSKNSIEATWKYLLVGSVGIALALLGTFFLAYAALQAGLHPSLMYADVLKNAQSLSAPWLKAAFILLLTGYGTKMGLAPMHTWKPDAYGEAPGLIGAILSGGVTSCAFLAFLRIYHIGLAAGQGEYTGRMLIFMGLFSMGVAALCMLGQKDFKRMLAYSSVEHMGILMVGLGLGGAALFGTVFHLMANSLTKGILFLSAGNIHRAFGSKNIREARGAMERLPLSGALFLAGMLAITGSPPFAPFISEFTILSGAMAQGRFAVAGFFLLFLFVIFIGFIRTVLAVVHGSAPAESMKSPYRDGILTAAPPLLLMIIVLALGLYLPDSVRRLLEETVRFLESRP